MNSAWELTETSLTPGPLTVTLVGSMDEVVVVVVAVVVWREEDGGVPCRRWLTASTTSTEVLLELRYVVDSRPCDRRGWDRGLREVSLLPIRPSGGSPRSVVVVLRPPLGVTRPSPDEETVSSVLLMKVLEDDLEVVIAEVMLTLEEE